MGKAAEQLTGRGNSGKAWQAPGTELQPKPRGWAAGEALPALEQQMHSRQKAPSHRALQSSQAASTELQTQGASLQQGWADTLQPAQPDSCHTPLCPAKSLWFLPTVTFTHPVNTNIIPMNQTKNASAFHFLPLAEDHLTSEMKKFAANRPTLWYTTSSRSPGWYEVRSASYYKTAEYRGRR